LEQRLARSGVDAVNAYLSAQGASAMVALNAKTAACELSAVSLAIRRDASRNARAVQAHGESRRAAGGPLFAGFILAWVAPAGGAAVLRFVASWGPAQTARELRRRISDIEADEDLRSSRRGQACRAAYDYELRNTRVVVRGPRAGWSPPKQIAPRPSMRRRRG